MCSIWNWQQSNRLNRFSNGNPKGSRINEARFINEDDQALMMTGSSDGVIKIFRKYESEDVELVSAFRALTDIVPSNKNAGLVLDWQQGQGKLLVAGDVKVVRVWNAATEICTSVWALPLNCSRQFTSDILTTATGHPCPLRLLHNLPDLGPSRWQRLLRRLRRRRHPHLRHPPKVRTSHGTMLAKAQAMDHQCAYATRWS